MRKAVLALLFGYFGLFVPAIASTNELGSVEDIQNSEVSDTVANDLYSVFLGCMHNYNDCHHEAEHHGYHHYFARYDHHRCPDHHHPLACYGQN